MIQIYRVKFAFEAKHLDQEPPLIETLHVNDLLVVLSKEGSYVTFCRRDALTELSDRSQFLIFDEEFQQCVETLES